MPTNDLKIGIIGGYVSGKATFLNALFKAPYFRMRSNTHNHTTIQIRAVAGEKDVVWSYMDEDGKNWNKSQEDIRFSTSWKRIKAEIPCFLWGSTSFYDFPQINDVVQWEKENIQEVSQMDGLVCVLDAEYLMSERNKKMLAILSEYNLIAVVLNKCDIIDDIAGLRAQLQRMYSYEIKEFRLFTVSSQLELQRWTAPKERIKNFAFSELRNRVMITCDLAFSDLRVWLYELINVYNRSTSSEKEK